MVSLEVGWGGGWGEDREWVKGIFFLVLLLEKKDPSLKKTNKQKTNQPKTPNATYLPPYPFSLKENKNSFLKLIVR